MKLIFIRPRTWPLLRRPRPRSLFPQWYFSELCWLQVFYSYNVLPDYRVAQKSENIKRFIYS